MKKKIKVGIVGCGNIGSNLARFISSELKQTMSLLGVYDIDLGQAEKVISTLKHSPKFLPPRTLVDKVDLVIEAAEIDAAKELIEVSVKKKKDIMVLSLGAFIKFPDLITLIQKHQGNVYIPSGAICGLDGIKSARLAGIEKITLTTSKPPKSLTNITFLEKKGIDVFSIKKETVVFKGGVCQAVRFFPKNINVAAALYLASRCRKLEVVVKVDPSSKRNTHRIEAVSPAARIKVEVENVPSPDNPKTSYLTILSAQSLLRQLCSPVKIGT